MKKLLSILMIMIMTMSVLAGCGGGGETTTEAKADDAAKSVNIGIIQYMQHASLDEAYEGFVDGLAEAGYKEGENLALNYQNASGEVSNCQQICGLFANNNTDLVLAIATPAAQSAVNQFQETEIPVLFTAVTDAVGAGLVDSNEAPGMEVIIQTSSSSNDIPQVISSVVGAADAIYIPSDNAFASAMATVNKAAVDNQIPVFCAVEAMIAEGGIATTAIDYYELGKQTAAQAVRVLNGEKASEIAVETQKECALVVNETFAKSVGVTVPAEMLEKAATKY